MRGVDVPAWQVGMVMSVVLWMMIARVMKVSVLVRSLLQPFVTRLVHQHVPLLLRFQSMQHPFLDVLFTVSSTIVSVEFYTAFLPFLFWIRQDKLARQMTLLMAFCIYVGNIIKDTVSAPRPPSPPVRRHTVTDSEQGFAMEYGLPSSHTINTLCLLGYLFLHWSRDTGPEGISNAWLFTSLVALVTLTALARLYLGMHSPIDIFAGILVGISVLGFWCIIDDPLDSFITSGKNVVSFWMGITIVLLFAYPTPEAPTPSFEYHTAFNGVALGVVWGVSRTFENFDQGEDMVAAVALSNMQIVKRMLLGFPTVLAIKSASKEVAKRLLPTVCTLLDIPIKSSVYIPDLVKGSEQHVSKKLGTNNEVLWKFGYIPRSLIPAWEEPFDVDTGIRLLQYAGLGWSVVEVAPHIFNYTNC